MSEPSGAANAPRTVTTQVCVAGGGPAGVMLGLLLARAGIHVVVLEKHADFFRDFRGDTVHPSTLNLIDQLGLRAAFDRIPHTPLPRLDVVVNGVRLHAIDFGSLPAPNRAITLMPQWDLLRMLADEGARLPNFELRMDADVVDVLHGDGRIVGVEAHTTDGPLRVEAVLTVAADGRDSTVRRRLGLALRAFGVPVDVAWFRLDRPSGSQPDTLGHLSASGFLVTIPRPDYLQCGLLIPKGTYKAIESSGIVSFRERIVRAAPRLADVTTRLTSFDEVKLLAVQIDRLRSWSVPGALCIGDAAHAMSPVFGVGINYAIQDAVATANLLVPVFRAGGSPLGVDAAIDAAVLAVQRRREWPTAMMQRLQRLVHRGIGTGAGRRLLQNPPTRAQRVVLRLVIPIVRPLAARVVGYGFRPERISPTVLDHPAVR